MNHARPLNADQRTHTATRLRAIADQLEADHATAVMANLATTADPTPWPATSGGPGSASGGPGSASGLSSPVEAALDHEIGAHTMARAARLLLALHELARIARTVDDGLAEWNPRRTVAYCPNPTCGRALAIGGRCTSCSTRQQAKPTCDDCGRDEDRHGLRPWPTASWTGWTDGMQRQVCVTDWMWRHRHDGRPRNSIERLALGAGLIEAAGS